VSRWPVAGPSEYWLLANSPASKVKKQQYTHSTTNTHKVTTPTQDNYNNTHGQTNNNYIQDNLKLATVHTRQIRIQLQWMKLTINFVISIFLCYYIFIFSLYFILQLNLKESTFVQYIKSYGWILCLNSWIFLPPSLHAPSLNGNGSNFGFKYDILSLSIRRTYIRCRVCPCARMRFLYIYSMDIHEICYCQPTQP